ncbi:MAG: hypothetical protein M1828_007475 [Chrysothrix sp. TS-e1954]|nr:MAG: hypothetical protein M1828_007475 [Chrysothrix sp. TS-e1954]
MSHHPVLSSSAAIRESTPSSPLAHHVASSPGAGSTPQTVRPAQGRSVSNGGRPKDSRNISEHFIGATGSRSAPRSQSADVGPGVANAVTPSASPSHATTEIRAGLVQKAFYIRTDLLISKSPYFASLQNPAGGKSTSSSSISSLPSIASSRLGGPFFYPDLDEFAFALFVSWIHRRPLHGPTDFHSTNHYLCLYVLARRFQIEELQNTVMDCFREYYHEERMTAPAFRLQYIYGNTEGPCFMRQFLVYTAAYRASADDADAGLSDSIKGVLRGGGDLATDFAGALIAIGKDDRLDVRKGLPRRQSLGKTLDPEQLREVNHDLRATSVLMGRGMPGRTAAEQEKDSMDL